jgi:hypothetical protein
VGEPNAQQASTDQKRKVDFDPHSKERRDLRSAEDFHNTNAGFESQSPANDERMEIELPLTKVAERPPDVKSAFGFFLSPTLSPQTPDSLDTQEQDAEMSDHEIKKEG